MKTFCVFHKGSLLALITNVPVGLMPTEILAHYADKCGFSVDVLTYACLYTFNYDELE